MKLRFSCDHIFPTTQFECDVLVEDDDNIYFGEGKTRLGPQALSEIDTKMAKIK